jgi:hypothetical protein
VDIYIVLEEPVVGATRWPAKVIGAFTTMLAAQEEAHVNSYRYVVVRELEE